MVPLLSLWILTCAAKGPSNAAALTRVISAAEMAPAADLPATLIDGLLARGVGELPETCSAELRTARAATDPSARATAYANALRDLCPPSCASMVLADLANHPSDQRLPALIAACDAKGTDRVFGAEGLRDLRPKMDGMDFLLTRMILDPVFHATGGTPLGARYTALMPALADALTHVPKVEVRNIKVSDGLYIWDAQFQITASQAALEACYKDALKVHPRLSGEVKAVALVDATGRTLPNIEGEVPDDLLRCVDQVVGVWWHFNAPYGGEMGRLSATISFQGG